MRTTFSPSVMKHLEEEIMTDFPNGAYGKSAPTAYEVCMQRRHAVLSSSQIPDPQSATFISGIPTDDYSHQHRPGFAAALENELPVTTPMADEEEGCCELIRSKLFLLLMFSLLIATGLCLGFGLSILGNKTESVLCMVVPESFGSPCEGGSIFTLFRKEGVFESFKEIKPFTGGMKCGDGGILSNEMMSSLTSSDWNNCEKECNDWCVSIIAVTEDSFNSCCEVEFINSDCSCKLFINIPNSLTPTTDKVSAVQYFESEKIFHQDDEKDVFSCYLKTTLNTNKPCPQRMYDEIKAKMNKPFPCLRKHSLCEEGDSNKLPKSLGIILMTLAACFILCLFAGVVYKCD